MMQVTAAYMHTSAHAVYYSSATFCIHKNIQLYVLSDFEKATGILLTHGGHGSEFKI